MLSYLVTSKARRRLLGLLWGDRASGTATQLAAKARVSFASAYRELREMDRWGLVSTHDTAEGLVYAARGDHPEAALLTRLATSKPSRVTDDRARETRAQLAAAGAPLRAEEAGETTPPFAQLIAEGVQLARRDPEVARALPVLLHQRRAELDAVVKSDEVKPVSHSLGFFVALTGRLSGDRRLQRLAASLRDHRVRRQDLFLRAAPRASSSKSFALANAWGFRAGADLAWFDDLFRKFATAPGDAA